MANGFGIGKESTNPTQSFGLDFSTNESFLSSLGRTTGGSSSVNDLGKKDRGMSSEGQEALGTALSGVADITGSILEGALSSSATDKAKALDEEMFEGRRQDFLTNLAENEKLNQESFQLQKEATALQARDAELNLRLKKWMNEFKKASESKSKLEQAAGKLSSQLSARPDIAERIAGR